VVEARRRFGLPDDTRTRIIGQIGRLIEAKGQTILLHAAKKILNQGSNVAFLMIGYAVNRQYRDTLIQLAHQLGIADHVRIVSYPGSIGDAWKAIDVHVHPSLFDSQPISVIEGMSLGKPAVVTSVGGLPEMVEHGRTGLLIPPGDPDALCAAVLQLLQDPALPIRLGSAARERYAQRHRPEVMARALEKVFLEMIN
jgi:glycosyltransferase involved in cell wall biosynthesis